jgi:hypothetical protein
MAPQNGKHGAAALLNLFVLNIEGVAKLQFGTKSALF